MSGLKTDAMLVAKLPLDGDYDNGYGGQNSLLRPRWNSWGIWGDILQPSVMRRSLEGSVRSGTIRHRNAGRS